MNCQECGKKIKAFSDRKLRMKDTLEFINHVSNCKACYEEAKTQWLYYRVDDILQDKIENPDYNLKYAFDRELDEREGKIRNFYLTVSVFVLLLILSVLIFVLFML